MEFKENEDIQHAEQKQAANRPNETEEKCDHVVDEEMRRNTSNTDISEQTSYPNINSAAATESEDMNREVESEQPNTCVDSNPTTSKMHATNEDVETVVGDQMRRNVSKTDVNEQTSHPNISSSTATESDDINRKMKSEQPNNNVDNNLTTSKIDAINQDAKTASLKEVTETAAQVLNDNGRLEENGNVAETPAQVLNDNIQLEENANVTETPAQVLNDNIQLEENANVTETPAQVLNDNIQLEENANVTETPAQALNDNIQLEENANVTETPAQVLNDNIQLEENANVTETPAQVLNDNIQLEENANVTETPAQVLNDNIQLEENAKVTETHAQVLNDNGRLEENANVTETAAQALNDNSQLEENANVTETPAQVLSDNSQLEENASVTETPAQVLNDNSRLEDNSRVAEKGVEKRHNRSTKLSFPSPSGSRNSENTENGKKKVAEKVLLESTNKPEETKSLEHDEDKKHIATSVLAVWSQNVPSNQDDQLIFQKPDTRSRIQKLLARRRGEKERKPVKRVTTTNEAPNIMSQLDGRLNVLDQVITRDFHDDMFLARQLAMPKLFQRSPKLQARWQVTHDMRMLQEVLVAIRWARERREEEKMKESEAEAAQDDPTADDSEEKEDANAPESSNPSPENSSPDITIAMIHAEDPPTADDEGSAHTGDETSATATLDASEEEQKNVVESTSGTFLRNNRRDKTAISRAESRFRLARSYTTVPFQLPQSTSLAGRRQPPPSQQRTSNAPALVSSAAPGRLRRTITSLSMSRGGRSSATRVSPAMMGRIQDAAKIYGGRKRTGDAET